MNVDPVEGYPTGGPARAPGAGGGAGTDGGPVSRPLAVAVPSPRHVG